MSKVSREGKNNYVKLIDTSKMSVLDQCSPISFKWLMETGRDLLDSKEALKPMVSF